LRFFPRKFLELELELLIQEIVGMRSLTQDHRLHRIAQAVLKNLRNNRLNILNLLQRVMVLRLNSILIVTNLQKGNVLIGFGGEIV